jgi:hypothetical protein
MQLPFNDDEIDAIIFVITPTNSVSCDKCMKWRKLILSELKVGNFGNVGKNIMHLANHLQRDSES